jgi:hypothetical protein
MIFKKKKKKKKKNSNYESSRALGKQLAIFLYNLVGRPVLMWQLGAWSEGKSGPFTT